MDPGADGGGRADGGRGRDVLPHLAARSPDLRSRGAPPAHALHRPRRCGGAARRRRARHRARHLDRAHVRLDRASVDHRLHSRRSAREAGRHRRASARRLRDPACRGRRDREPRTGLFRRLHGSRADREGVRRGRLVSHRRHRRARRRRLPHDHRSQERRDHPRRREHQCRRGRGRARADRWRARVCGRRRSGPSIWRARVRVHPRHDAVDGRRATRDVRRRSRSPEVAGGDPEIAEFPRTASGKIQKFVLRQQLREEAT